ncbi:hypothetical protein NBO_2g0029 [Nosema bombycis CQ1]|uniref:Uncharacterized protein n=1 Tax=Nosema bombycis (strain CQ1 / CVCC 102059) TaxID=578461 RepID=R0KZA4_NOSB1|nr:hypothetical protein NBO_2g0029 [Nosema bombycis CQ1]|eukprot:EOB15537.1 hypothetical protein NBO_2g0029 [Nosema bombycis CQ1]
MNVFMQILRDFVCFLFMQIYHYLALKQQGGFFPRGFCLFFIHANLSMPCIKATR